MMGRRPRTYTLLLALALVAMAPVFAGAQALTTYDDFGAARIDRDRWRGFEHVTAYRSPDALAGGWQNWVEDEATSDPALSVANQLAVRAIVSGKLRLALTTHGGASASGITPGVGRLGIRMRQAVDTMLSRLQARVTVVSVTAEGCLTDDGRTRAQILAHFFSDGSGDVFASLSLEHRSVGRNRIVAVVSRCRDSSCTVADDIDFVVFNRTWTPGAAHLLTITNQPNSSRFAFAVSGGASAGETRTVSYPAVTSPAPPVRPFRDLRVENAPAFCAPSAGGVTRARVTMDTRFDDVRTNVPAAGE